MMLGEDFFASKQSVTCGEVPFDAESVEVVTVLNFNLLYSVFVVEKRNVLDNRVTAFDVILGKLLACEGSRDSHGGAFGEHVFGVRG